MEKVMEILNYIMSNGPAMVASLVALVSALIAVFMFIPGEQPEKTLKKILEVLNKIVGIIEKLSVKPKE